MKAMDIVYLIRALGLNGIRSLADRVGCMYVDTQIDLVFMYVWCGVVVVYTHACLDRG